MGAVIEIQGLRKTYRRIRKGTTVALDGLDLSVSEGGVFGFLGPNGSGKTTAIRCLLGLVSATDGHATVFGQAVPKALPRVIRDIGAVVETPALFPNFSARKNLRLLGGIDGIGKKRVDQVLETIGLADRADDAVKTYSLGMRQRLGIGATLLKDPKLLILDEPANGLDPPGIRDIRALMRRLGDEGRTVFVSSHVLSEIQNTCDSVAVLAKGRCVVSGTVDEVLASGSKPTGYILKVVELEAGLRVLLTAGFDAKREGDHLTVNAGAELASRITEALGRERLWLTELQPNVANLEDVFLELIGETPKEGGGSDAPTFSR